MKKGGVASWQALAGKAARRAADPAFRARVDALRGELVSDAVGRLAALLADATGALKRALTCSSSAVEVRFVPGRPRPAYFAATGTGSTTVPSARSSPGRTMIVSPALSPEITSISAP
jgi:hypothetical protein